MEERRRWWFAAAVIGWMWLGGGQERIVGAAEVLARVNGDEITRDDLAFELMLSGLLGKQPEEIERRKLEHLIERKLVVKYLEQQGVKPDPRRINLLIQRIRKMLEDAGLDPDATLAEKGYTPPRLRSLLAASVMWDQYLSSTIDDQKLQAYFESRKSHFDGTEVRVSQILLPLSAEATPEEIAEAKRKLLDYKRQIERGSLSFAEAARKWSMAPSAESGGDQGFSFFDGPLPGALAGPAFELEPGKLSDPFQTRFGMHLITVTEVRPGQFELEDVRETVRKKLHREMWDKLVPRLREAARIEYVN
jgi:hypothetical protein